MNYQPKQAKTLSRDEIRQFLEQAPDDQYLLTKVCTTNECNYNLIYYKMFCFISGCDNDWDRGWLSAKGAP